MTVAGSLTLPTDVVAFASRLTLARNHISFRSPSTTAYTQFA